MKDTVLKDIAVVVGVCYGAMVLFIAIPAIKLFWLDQDYPVTATIVSLLFAVAFGVYATITLEDYNKKKTSYKDRTLKMPCPDCHSKLMQLTSIREELIQDNSKGLIYCTECDYEVSKDEFDRKYPNHD